MSEIPYATEMRSTYENFIARCPRCGFENIFNRASDLKDFRPIDFKVVTCLSTDCRQPFTINGDFINPAFEMLVSDCHELLERKHYAYCVLILAQAFEVFFSHFLRVELLYRPFGLEEDPDIERLNHLARLLYKEVRQLSYRGMRDLFFRRVLKPIHPKSLREAEDVIVAPDFRSDLRLPDEDELQNAGNQRLSAVLTELRSCRVHELRNRVAHKMAYRPTLDEVNAALGETRRILFPLAYILGVRCDDINCYVRSAPQGD
jgi:hypothetical protein